MFKIEPGEEVDFTEKNEVNETVRQTWNMLGLIRLLELVKNSVEPVDFSLAYGKSIDKMRTQVHGQFDERVGKCLGVCRLIFAEPNSHIYEG